MPLNWGFKMKLQSISLLPVLLGGAAALGAPSPPTTQIMGTFAGNSVVDPSTRVVCTIEPGRGEFQRSKATVARANPPAILAMPRMATYNAENGSGYKASDGLVLLVFASATAGVLRIDFDYSAAYPKLPSGESVPFKGFKEVWDPEASTLRVTFDVVFSHCTLPVRALFRAAP
jgi:hypothetical protein